MDKSKSSFIYLIDTGVHDNGHALYKFGQTRKITERFNSHKRIWKDMKVVHIERVINPFKCEHRLKNMCEKYLYKGDKCSQREILHGVTDEWVIKCMKNIANEEGLSPIEKHGEHMTVISKLDALYKHYQAELDTTWDPCTKGSTRSTYQKKYIIAMRHMLLHILRECLKHKVLFNPMMIAVDFTVPKDHWAVFDLESNTIKVNTLCSKIVIDMLPVHSDVVTTLLEDYNELVYLFHHCKVLPKNLTKKEIKVMNTYYSRLLMACSVNNISVDISSIKDYMTDKPNDVVVEKYTTALTEINALKKQIAMLEAENTKLKSQYIIHTAQ